MQRSEPEDRPEIPGPGALPEAIPVFPLAGALLLPGGRLPLNIFEPRYLAMVEDALGAGRLIGMIQPDASRPETSQGPTLFGIGCVGRITSFIESGDGRFLVSLLGLTRFSILEELPLRRGYRRVRPGIAAFAADVEAAGPLGIARDDLVQALRRFFDRQGITTDWEAIRAMDDPALVTALCMMCPFAPSEKQALLEAPDLARRAEALLALLRIGLHGTPTDPGDQRPS